MSSGSWDAVPVPVPAQRGRLLGQAGAQGCPWGCWARAAGRADRTSRRRSTSAASLLLQLVVSLLGIEQMNLPKLFWSIPRGHQNLPGSCGSFPSVRRSDVRSRMVKMGMASWRVKLMIYQFRFENTAFASHTSHSYHCWNHLLCPKVLKDFN